MSKLERAKPIYTFLDGWKCDISGIREYSDLPVKAKNMWSSLKKNSDAHYYDFKRAKT